jgi:hypothetical protein
LLEKGAEHDAAHDEAVLKLMQEIRDEMKSLRHDFETKMDAMNERQTKTESRVDSVFGNIRAFGIGWASAFTLIGAGAVAGFEKLAELFK